ncbi:hypothetical protein CROQUDRAFT_90878 [Cronartium quercuum f. sp. fusiforme G11]|uniref:Uncharacterized protein n=1 Tax=Cronartium quercuum f. sp. fusiforme G11 TaxID=708437 RepID=A0A9P6NKZ3_9BASI|nr:hypothetical protein CROQUDRAFT_90878 [Cronartium quercuum f. sp. fusiforme G11]
MLSFSVFSEKALAFTLQSGSWILNAMGGTPTITLNLSLPFWFWVAIFGFIFNLLPPKILLPFHLFSRLAARAAEAISYQPNDNLTTPLLPTEASSLALYGATEKSPTDQLVTKSSISGPFLFLNQGPEAFGIVSSISEDDLMNHLTTLPPSISGPFVYLPTQASGPVIKPSPSNYHQRIRQQLVNKKPGRSAVA